MHKILIVDDEENVLKSLSRLFRSPEFEVTCFSDPLAALDKCGEELFDLVISDQRMPMLFGIDLLDNIMQVQPGTRRILISGYSDFQDVVDAFNEGVIHKFLMKPWDNDVLVSLVNDQLSEELQQQDSSKQVEKSESTINFTGEGEPQNFHGIITADKGLLKQLSIIPQVAGSDAPFYINGETGTGKELVARAIHEESKRRDGPFVAINCANLTGELLESQLFGHRKGAFTGADKDQQGLFAAADTCTLFLDEVVEIPINMQAKLLRVLQEKEFTPIGETTPVSFDCQVVSASAVSLADAVANKTFREDLRFRLEVMTVNLPPLRMRGNDIRFLFNSLLEKEMSRQGVAVKKVEPAIYESISGYGWPGNVREMVNVCTYIIAMANAFDGVISADCLPENIRNGTAVTDLEKEKHNQPDNESLKKMDREGLLQALEVAEGNRSAAARALGVSRMTLYRKLKEFGLE